MNSNEYVIILHGMGLKPFWMGRIAHNLRKNGYTVINLGYPSTRKPVEQLMTEHLIPAIRSLPDDVKRLNFVTHSLGSILVRLYHQTHTPPAPGRTVMIGPPNNGSEVADYLKNWRLYKWFFGDAGQALGRNDLPCTIGPANFEAGVIAGKFHWLHAPSGPFMPKPNDGLVTVESTKLDGMKDHIVLNVDHSNMVFSKRVIQQVLAFLKTGQFAH